jgi:uncharacterized protein (DUF305 family)
MRRQVFWRLSGAALLLVVSLIALQRSGAAGAQGATPTAYSCEAVATPAAGTDHGGMDMGTPAATAEFDQLYIDMMIPHHASIIALSQAALPRLQDERLRTIAENVIATQTAEIDELRGYRELFYGSAEPAPMDEQAMMQIMPGITMPMADMMTQMDAWTQVALFCAADDPDLAFIDLVIPHHQSAIVASEVALDRATHEEIRALAGRVIEDQQREIDELGAIRQELFGSATPESVGA